MSRGEIRKQQIAEISKLFKFTLLFLSAPLIVLSIFYLAVNHSFILVLLLLVIFGPILILTGDFLESRQKTERKAGICIVCGKKLSITKNLCLNCFKDYDLVKWNQLWSWYMG